MREHRVQRVLGTRCCCGSHEPPQVDSGLPGAMSSSKLIFEPEPRAERVFRQHEADPERYYGRAALADVHAVQANFPLDFEKERQGHGRAVEAATVARGADETAAQQWGHISAHNQQGGQPTRLPGSRRRRVPAAYVSLASAARDRIATPPESYEKSNWIREGNAVALFPAPRYPQEITPRK